MILYITIFNSIVLLAALFGLLFLYYRLAKNNNLSSDIEKDIEPIKKPRIKINNGSLCTEDGFIRRDDLYAVFGDKKRIKCSSCSITKPSSMFSLNATKKNGLQSRCKNCHNTLYGKKSKGV